MKGGGGKKRRRTKRGDDGKFQAERNAVLISGNGSGSLLYGQTVLRTKIQRYKQGASDSDSDSEDKEKKMKRGWKRKDKGKGRGLITGEAHPRRWSRLQIKDAQWSFAS